MYANNIQLARKQKKHQDKIFIIKSHQYQENILWNLRCLTFIYFINIITAQHIELAKIKQIKTKGLMSNNFNYLQFVQPLIRENHYLTYQKQNRQQQFNSQADYDQMKQSMSTTQPNQTKSRQNLYLLKLQSKVLQLKKKLDYQNFQIQTLTEEADNYVKLCQSQKSLINSLNIQMMRQQYQQQITHLTYQNQKSKDLAFTIQQQCNSIHKEQSDKLCKFRMQNQEITKKIEQALSRKEQYIYKIHEKEQQTKKYEQTLDYQQQKIDQLRHIQRKFIIALKQIQKLKLY